jgi:hypothetical protein
LTKVSYSAAFLPFKLAHAKTANPVASPSSVRSILPAIGFRKLRFKQLEAVQLIREQRDNGKQELAFHAHPPVLCGIQLHQPPRNQTSHTRRNGRFFLQIIGHPEFGLPFG